MNVHKLSTVYVKVKTKDTFYIWPYHDMSLFTFDFLFVILGRKYSFMIV